MTRGSLIGKCVRCQMPASLRCVVCGLTMCVACLDSEERVCPDCRAAAAQGRDHPVGHPPHRKIGPHRPHPRRHP